MTTWYSTSFKELQEEIGFVIYRDPTNIKRWWCMRVYPIGYWGE